MLLQHLLYLVVFPPIHVKWDMKLKEMLPDIVSQTALGLAQHLHATVSHYIKHVTAVSIYTSVVVCNKDQLIPQNTSALTIDAPRWTFNSNAMYSCLPGYALRGTIMRTCQDNGNWSSVASYCESKHNTTKTPVIVLL